MTRTRYLIQRGNRWYLRLPVPRPIRHLFPSGKGKPRDYIVEPLGVDYTPARTECAQRVAEYRALFAYASIKTPDEVSADIAAIKGRGAARLAAQERELKQQIELVHRIWVAQQAKAGAAA